MFHGVEWRDGARSSWPTASLGRAGDTVPIELAVNLHRLRDVIEPGLNLVVSQRVREALASFPNIEFVRVKFGKLIRYPYSEGDLSFYETRLADASAEFGAILDDADRVDAIMEDPEELYELLPDHPDARGIVAPYYEMRTSRVQDVKFDFVPLKVVELAPVPGWPGSPNTEVLSLSLLRSYPIIRSPLGIVFSDDAFSVISPFLDRDYFSVATVEV
ncbi:MAG TPA: hypothetical protein VND64_15605 [Pirellulales bacterium]|nr:hypothetical protein [Pirellulales bacterium]